MSVDINKGDILELLIQDILTDLDKFGMLAQCHIVKQ